MRCWLIWGIWLGASLEGFFAASPAKKATENLQAVCRSCLTPHPSTSPPIRCHQLLERLFKVANPAIGRIHDLAQFQVPGTVAQLFHLGIERFATKLPGGAAGTCFIGEYGIELDGVDLGEVETACFIWRRTLLLISSFWLLMNRPPE